VKEVTRLIVGIKQPHDLRSTVSVGGALVEQLLLNTKVEDSVIHRCGRRGMGVTRRVQLTPAQRADDPWSPRGNEGRWKAPAFQDFTGDFCDRLLLGRQQTRTAVLSPYDVGCVAESLGRTLEAHPGVGRGDILIVTPALSTPFGQLAMAPLADADGVIATEQVQSVLDDHFAVRGHIDTPTPAEATWLGVGVDGVSTMRILADALAPGGGAAEDSMEMFLEAPLADAELQRMEEVTLPLAAYVASLWVDDPATATAYAIRDKHAVNESAKRLWLETQTCMARYKDTVLLGMHTGASDMKRRVGPRDLQRAVDGIADKHVRRREEAQDRAKFIRENAFKDPKRRGWKSRR
jgi:hypothetical protein